MIENEGMFFFKGYMEAIDAMKRDTDKWRMVKAIYEYGVKGVEPEEKLLNSGIFRLVRAVIDGREKARAKQKRGSRASKSKGRFKDGVEGDFCGAEKTIEDNSEVNQKVGMSAPLYNKNKNKNKNKNENKNSSSNENSKTVGEVKTRSHASREVGVPKMEEVREFIEKAKLEVVCEQFYAYYEAKGWKVRGKPVKDWKALILAWAKRGKKEKLETKKSSEPSEGFYRKLLNEVGPEKFDEMMFDNIDDIEI